MSRTPPRTSPIARWKGKARAVHSEESRDEGTGGPDGIVLPLNMVGAGMYEAVYTVTVQVGSNNQNFSLQVDLGSSDLWIASTSCTSTACSGAKGRQYDPSVSGVATGSQFNIGYLAGNVSGPIYWDYVQIGGYSLSNQALAAATTVASEPLEHEFNGILGLALPLNSVIANTILPTVGDGRDGAPFSSNLFGITPAELAPSSRFFSLSLSRPGSTAVPSMLGIGRHPSQLVHDPSQIQYSTPVQARQGTLFWEVDVLAITIYHNGTTKSVQLGHSRSGNAFPTAILDSGVPFILTTSAIANGIYGALGIGPSADGQYYLPCTTPINITITLDGQPEIPLHPLDLTTESQSDPSSSNCVGLIQTGSGAMDTATNVPDMILGVAFLRNVYTVMAYDAPNAKGIFPANVNTDANNQLHPRLGFLGLTNTTQAMQEFNNVHVFNRPLSSGNGSSPASAHGTSSSSKLSVGADVLLVLLCLIVASAALFGLRWFLVRRQLRRGNLKPDGADTKPSDTLGAYQLAPHASLSSMDLAPVLTTSRRSMAGNSTRTFVGQDEAGLGEFGFPRYKGKDDDAAREVSFLNLDPADPAGWRETLVGSTIDFPQPSPQLGAFDLDGPMSSTQEAALAAATAARLPLHRHTTSDINAGADGFSIAEPLLAHARGDSNDSAGGAANADAAEFGAGVGSMAGVGTAARSPRIRARHGSNAASVVSLGHISLASVATGGRFPSIAPGERLSGLSMLDGYKALPPMPPPPS
ncbi:aspartic peptidase domain-containing protein [Lactifluus subvellereus]|nr:aspartic peptidase domain-containing protein [Lactifluus subvellereus]